MMLVQYNFCTFQDIVHCSKFSNSNKLLPQIMLSYTILLIIVVHATNQFFFYIHMIF